MTADLTTLDRKGALARLDHLFGSPELFPQQLDLTLARVLLLQLDERRYHEAAFLDERLARADLPGFWVSIGDLDSRFRAQPSQPPPRHWIFHVGHCGSTLLSRLLDSLGGYLPLREPPALRSLADAYRGLGNPLSRIDPSRWPDLLDLFLALFGRRYRVEGPPLVKATSSCNNLIAPVLEAAPGSRTILLYVSLEKYLATMLRAGGSRTDIEGHAASRLQDLLGLVDGNSDLRLYQLSLPQRAVVNWLSSVAHFSVASVNHPERVRLLDFDVLLGSLPDELEMLCRHFGCETARSDVESVLASGVMDRYAKAPEHAYSVLIRSRELGASMKRHGDEIRQALIWAEKLISSHPAIEQMLDSRFLPGSS